jgi:hypothetical protein
MITCGALYRVGAAGDRSKKRCKSGVSATGLGPILLQSGCDRARRHRPTRHAASCRAGRPPRAAPPEHRHRRGDRAARRNGRPGRAPGQYTVPAAAPGPGCSRRRLRAAVLITAHARAGESKAPSFTTPYWSLRSTHGTAAELAIYDHPGQVGGLVSTRSMTGNPAQVMACHDTPSFGP